MCGFGFGLVSVLGGLLNVQATAGAQEIDFNHDVRPILSQHCIVCHGPDEGTREAGYRIDIRDEALAGIEPGDPESSEIIYRITAEDDDRMPPPEHGGALSPTQIATLTAWIEQGAKFEQHWSFVAPKKADPPAVTGEFVEWKRNEIDQFVAAKLATADLPHSPDAAPRRLIRRLALDLTGLPPTPTMVERFVQSPTDATYDNIVDELLNSPNYGEHWTSMWLDLARYADTIGYAEDKNRTIWPWRDWVIQAFNDNMPYDEFAIEQLAGDLLPDPTDDQKLATAFHRNTLNNTEGGTSDEEFRTIAVKDRISTTVNVWMGLTMRCAECHTHKYDPISHREYYQFLDFFNQSVDADQNDDRPLLGVFPKGRELELAKLDQQIQTLTTELETDQVALDRLKTEHALKQNSNPEQSNPETANSGQPVAGPADSNSASPTSQPAADLEAFNKQLEKSEKQLAEKRKQLDRLTQQRQAPVHVPVMQELAADKHRETHVMTRGSYLQPAEKVEAGVPAAFPPLPKSAPPNRLGVAMWLVDDANPLTARVAVNRFWAQFFGMGIVETEEDFGTQGTPPSNQELLDWLAVDFRENGWDVKRLLKQIVTSSTYRQSSVVTAEQLERDPRNRLLSHGPRFRLSAEVIRDQALAVSGLLSDKHFGPPVYPPNPVKKVRSAFQGDTVWVESQGPDRYRRALYTYLKRSAPHPLFETFDMATREVCNLRRIRTNTPLQSFMTLNDRTFIEAAQALAAKMYLHSDNPRQQIEYGLQVALLRPGQENQIDGLANLYAETLETYRAAPEDALALVDAIESFGIDQETLNRNKAELAALTVVSNVILNLDAFLTK